MKKGIKIATAALLCMTMLLPTGCSLKDKVKNKTREKINTEDYVTLGDYSKIELKKSAVDERIQGQIDQTLNSYATYGKKKKGKVKSGDTVNIYYVGKINGKKFEGGTCTKKNNPEGYNLTIGSNTFIEGFEDGLIGKSVGETVDVDTKFPDSYPNNPDYAGKKAVFTVTINYIRGKANLPELNDEFVKKNLTDYKSVDDYKTTLRTHALEDMAWDTYYDTCKVKKYPDARVKDMYNQLNTSINYYLSQNNYKLSDYLSERNTTSADFKKQMEDAAKEDVAKQLIYGAIAEKENIKVSDSEYKESLDNYLTNYGCKEEADLDKLFKSYYGTNAKDIINDDLLFRKVKTFLADKVKEV